MLSCDWSKVLKAGAPELPKNLHGLLPGSFVNFFAQQTSLPSGHLASWAELINTFKTSNEVVRGLILGLFLLSSHKSGWTQLDSEWKENVLILSKGKKILLFLQFLVLLSNLYWHLLRCHSKTKLIRRGRYCSDEFELEFPELSQAELKKFRAESSRQFSSWNRAETELTICISINGKF